MTQEAQERDTDEMPSENQAESKPLTNGETRRVASPGSNEQELHKVKTKKSDVNVLVMDSGSCWIISFALLVMNIMVPITGERVAVVAGSIGNSLCTIGVGLSPNISVFLICMAGKGICVGTAFVPAIAMISQYFERRRSIATALAYCGLGVGMMAAPPFVEYLKENFGISGMFLIVGALEMNSVPAAMLLRPLSRYKYVIFRDEDDGESESDGEEGDAKNRTEKAMKTLASEELTQDNSSHEKQRKDSDKTCECDGRNDSASDSIPFVSKENNHSDLATSSPATDGFKLYDQSIVNRSPKLRSLSFKDESFNVYQETTKPLLQGEAGQYPLVTTQLSVDSRTQAHHHTNVSNIGDFRPLQGNSIQHRETDNSQEISPNKLTTAVNGHHHHHHHKHPHKFNRELSVPASHSTHDSYLTDTRHRNSTWSIASAPLSEMPLDVEIIALENSERRSLHSGLNQIVHGGQQSNIKRGDSFAAKKLSCWGKTRTIFLSMFSTELLRTWCLHILLIGACTGSLLQYLLAYLPTLASKQGMDASQVAILLTVSGAVDLASRIVIGLFTDLKILTPGQIVAITQIIIGTTVHFVHFYTDFNWLMFLSVIIGLFGSTRQNLSTLITIEFMGLSRFRKALGFQAMISTLSLAIHHPLLSSILEATGSFAPPLHYVGIVLYISSVFVLMAPLAKRWDAKNEAVKNQENTSSA
ncbi:monocarboxylate transporter 5 [Plakobranchus ocellatus]|uniref:Monocarboxylate transporter 5 n=1 Tax=Plakobranchus ocellatus TaxID=259542 RepID=A0AAV4DEI6_9GAST|nr:monocarboxylate transporter 5 [Plakobranchus ocellatus]